MRLSSTPRVRLGLLLIICVFTACGGLPVPIEPPNHTLTIPQRPSTKGELILTILDVGQGDAALLQSSDGKTALIDGGPPGAGRAVLLPYLATHGIERLDLTIASHYDLDHIGGLPEVFDGPDAIPGTADDFIPSTCWDRGGDVPEDHPAHRAYAGRRTACQAAVRPGMEIPLGSDVTLQVLIVNGVLADGERIAIDPADENAHSIGMLLTYGSFHYLTAGDLPGGGGEPPYQTIDLETPLAALLPPVTVLHINHHGSATATNHALLAATMPQAAVISVGNANPYGHPHPSLLRRLTDAKIPIYLTEKGDQELPDGAVVTNGPIVITSDGTNYSIADP